MPERPRRSSGDREHPPQTVDVIRFVKRAQKLGFSLKEIRELLDLRSVPRRASKRVRRLARGKLSEIDDKIRDLEAMRKALSELLCACEGGGSVASRPIIESLNGCSICGFSVIGCGSNEGLQFHLSSFHLVSRDWINSILINLFMNDSNDSPGTCLAKHNRPLRRTTRFDAMRILKHFFDFLFRSTVFGLKCPLGKTVAR